MQWGSGMNIDSMFMSAFFWVKKKKEKKEIEPEGKTVRISVFFDGTANNRENVKLGVKNAPESAKNTIFDHGLTSYKNDYSNIAKLDRCFKKYNGVDYSDNIYVEGIGTEDKESDHLKGLSLGDGSTGVKEKAEKGVDKILYKITQQNIEDKKIKYVHLDSFGFSRGAAAARYFIYLVLKKRGSKIKDTLKERGYSIEQKPEVKFVGLFDTVASFGFIHSNDTSQLKLDSIKEAEYTLQLAAADEHRKNFRLTNIKSVRKSKGCEIFLPGVHSDIGGGYIDNYEEKDLVLMQIKNMSSYLSLHQLEVLDNERQRLIDEGWYKEDEVEIEYNNKFAKTMSVYGCVKVNKSNIRNTYNRIPLQIMAEFAQEKGKVNLFNKAILDYKVKGYIKEVKAEIEQYIPKPGSIDIHTISERLRTETLKNLRYKYFHFSANYNSISNPPRFSKGGPEYGKRERKDQYG
jgi:hypothetical protein